MSGAQIHIPVMLEEVLRTLAPQSGDVILDATFGAGGYSRAILQSDAQPQLIAIDRDPAAIARGIGLQAEFGARLKLHRGRFGDMALAAGGVSLQGVVFDLGISSPQIDEAGRGFSFRFDGPLDMRMDSSDGPTAAEVVNTLDEESLAGILFSLGEERHSRRIARTVIAARALKPIATTLEFAEIVRRSVPRSPDGIDPATRSFQALRIYVNDELAELERGLAAAEKLLAPGGRLVVVSFHSLEDRIVKQFLRARAGSVPGGSRHLPPLAANDDAPSFTLPHQSAQPLTPTDAEAVANPRARSARLRFAVRTGAPAWSRAEPISFPSLSVSPFSARGRL